MKRTLMAALAATAALPLLAAPALAGHEPETDGRSGTMPEGYSSGWDNDGGYRDGAGFDRHPRSGMYDEDDDAYGHRRDDRGRDDRRRADHGHDHDRHHGRQDSRRDGGYHGRDRAMHRGHGDDEEMGHERMGHYRGKDGRNRVEMMHRRHGEEMMGARHGSGMRRMARALRDLETYDADGDGKVTQAEVDSFRSDRLTRFDADKDGALSLSEYEQLWLDAMRTRMVDRFQRHDDDGDGRITVEEFSSRTRHMVRMNDRDGDGAYGYGDFGPRGGEEWRRMDRGQRQAVREASEPGAAGAVPIDPEATELMDADGTSDESQNDGENNGESDGQVGDGGGDTSN